MNQIRDVGSCSHSHFPGGQLSTSDGQQPQLPGSGGASGGNWETEPSEREDASRETGMIVANSYKTGNPSASSDFILTV